MFICLFIYLFIYLSVYLFPPFFEAIDFFERIHFFYFSYFVYFYMTIVYFSIHLYTILSLIFHYCTNLILFLILFCVFYFSGVYHYFNHNLNIFFWSNIFANFIKEKCEQSLDLIYDTLYLAIVLTLLKNICYYILIRIKAFLYLLIPLFIILLI